MVDWAAADRPPPLYYAVLYVFAGVLGYESAWLGAIGWVAVWGFSLAGQWLIANVARFQAMYLDIAAWLESHGLYAAGQAAQNFDASRLVGLFQRLAAQLNALASFTLVTLVFVILGLLEVPDARARLAAMDARRLVVDGIDPLERRRELAVQAESKASAPATKPVTFKDAALDYIDRHKAGWRNAKHGQQWENTLATYAFPTLGEIPVAEVDDKLVLEVLRPIWHTRTETATRVRSRIETVLDAARAGKLRQRDAVRSHDSR